MAAYVTFRDSDRVVERVFETQAAANARGQTAGISAWNGALGDDADVGQYISAAGVLSATKPATALVALQRTQLLTIHRAWLHYTDERDAFGRRAWWASVTGNDDALIATDKWQYQNAAAAAQVIMKVYQPRGLRRGSRDAREAPRGRDRGKGGKFGTE